MKNVRPSDTPCGGRPTRNQEDREWIEDKDQVVFVGVEVKSNSRHSEPMHAAHGSHNSKGLLLQK